MRGITEVINLDEDDLELLQKKIPLSHEGKYGLIEIRLIDSEINEAMVD